MDHSVKIPDPKGHTFYYRMRGKVYDNYSEYTEVLQPVFYDQEISP